MKSSESQKGMTLIEIMLVVAILAISVGLSVLYSQSSQVRADINSQVEQFVGHLRLAHTSANAGLNDTSHGIHLETDSFTIFEGTSFVEGADLNYEYELSATMQIQNISLNGGGSDIVFDAPKGNTSDFGTLEFQSDQANKTVEIEITRLGTVNY
ncbi:type II secretion system protein [Candidatus Peregrinibacteria bacterium]|jgi:prepilin-type N-terminal cleavage/methylation domain-containing protein|nr:type II secretion system protein [Candidatus Peregrinibacteria bacterium]MBT7736396.1 type II secretion system protein [Candidatus Peregrinibacteria bacterium]